MKRVVCNIALSLFVLLTCSFTCHGQNGPTNPTVTLSWTPSTTLVPAGTGICVYRGTAIGVYTKPALACSDVSTVGFTGCVAGVCTGYLDSSLTSTNRGTIFDYGVTEKFGANTESGYSNNVVVPIPNLNPPVQNPGVENGSNVMPAKDDTKVAVASQPDRPNGLMAVVHPGNK